MGLKSSPVTEFANMSNYTGILTCSFLVICRHGRLQNLLGVVLPVLEMRDWNWKNNTTCHFAYPFTSWFFMYLIETRLQGESQLQSFNWLQNSGFLVKPVCHTCSSVCRLMATHHLQIPAKVIAIGICPCRWKRHSSTSEILYRFPNAN